MKTRFETKAQRNLEMVYYFSIFFSLILDIFVSPDWSEVNKQNPEKGGRDIVGG